MTMEKPFSSSGSSYTYGLAAVNVDDSFEDGCCICLEPFNSLNPPTVTKCKHEYHLRCILEWSQRSKECPVCLQVLALKDPDSQVLLVAMENERRLRSMHNVQHIQEDNEVRNEVHPTNDTALEDRIKQQFAAIATRARNISRWMQMQMTPAVGPSQIFPSVSTANLPNASQANSSAEDKQNIPYGSSETSLPTSALLESSSVENRQGSAKFSLQEPNNPQRPSLSEVHSFSGSLKSRFSSASARYKESITKGTRGLKERLQARSSSVKELSGEVKREMSASISGVARMIERLELNSKFAGISSPSSPFSSRAVETSHDTHQGNNVETNVTVPSLQWDTQEIACDIGPNSTPFIRSRIPQRLEVLPEKNMK